MPNQAYKGSNRKGEPEERLVFETLNKHDIRIKQPPNSGAIFEDADFHLPFPEGDKLVLSVKGTQKEHKTFVNLLKQPYKEEGMPATAVVFKEGPMQGRVFMIMELDDFCSIATGEKKVRTVSKRKRPAISKPHMPIRRGASRMGPSEDDIIV